MCVSCVVNTVHAAYSKLVQTIHIIRHPPRSHTYLGTNATTTVSRPVELAWGATD